MSPIRSSLLLSWLWVLAACAQPQVAIPDAGNPPDGASCGNTCEDRENSPALTWEECPECGATGSAAGQPMYAIRGVCAYSNGPTLGLSACSDGGQALTSDRQTPVLCETVSTTDAESSLPQPRRRSW